MHNAQTSTFMVFSRNSKKKKKPNRNRKLKEPLNVTETVGSPLSLSFSHLVSTQPFFSATCKIFNFIQTFGSFSFVRTRTQFVFFSFLSNFSVFFAVCQFHVRSFCFAFFPLFFLLLLAGGCCCHFIANVLKSLSTVSIPFHVVLMSVCCFSSRTDEPSWPPFSCFIRRFAVIISCCRHSFCDKQYNFLAR